MQYKCSVILEAIRNNKKCFGSADSSPSLPGSEEEKQQCFGVSKVCRCRETGVSLCFSSSFWLNHSSWDERLRHLLKISPVLCGHVASHPTGMAQQQLCNEITTGNPEGQIYGTRKWLYLTGQTVLLPKLGMEINHFLLSETKGFNTF